jgi:hypothetical protein
MCATSVAERAPLWHSERMEPTQTLPAPDANTAVPAPYYGNAVVPAPPRTTVRTALTSTSVAVPAVHYSAHDHPGLGVWSALYAHAATITGITCTTVEAGVRLALVADGTPLEITLFGVTVEQLAAAANAAVQP